MDYGYTIVIIVVIGNIIAVINTQYNTFILHNSGISFIRIRIYSGVSAAIDEKKTT